MFLRLPCLLCIRDITSSLAQIQTKARSCICRVRRRPAISASVFAHGCIFFIAFATFSSHFCFSIQFPPSADLPPPYVLKTLRMEKPFTVPFRFHIFDSGEISLLGKDLSTALAADSLLPFHRYFFLLVRHFASSRILRIRAFNDSMTQF